MTIDYKVGFSATHPGLVALAAFAAPLVTIISSPVFMLYLAIVTLMLATPLWRTVRHRESGQSNIDLPNRRQVLFWSLWMSTIGILFLIGNLNAADHWNALERTIHVFAALLVVVLFVNGLNILSEEKKLVMTKWLLHGGIMSSIVLTVIGLAYALQNSQFQTDWLYNLPSSDRFNRALIVLVFLNALSFWHAVQVGQTKAAIALYILTGIASFLSVSESAKLAFLVMTIVYLLTTWRAILSIKLLGGVSLIAAWFLPLVAGILQEYAASNPTIVVWSRQYQAVYNALARLEIWTASGDRIAERPLLGWGLDGIQHHGLPTLREDFFREDGYVHHAHNWLIHAWIDLGLIGPIVFTIGFILLLRFLVQSEGRAQYFLATITFGVFCVAFVGHGLWETWWIALLGYVFGVSQILAGADMRAGK